MFIEEQNHFFWFLLLILIYLFPKLIIPSEIVLERILLLGHIISETYIHIILQEKLLNEFVFS